MCTGVELATLAATAGGTALSMDAQNDAAREQARIAGDRAREAGEFNRRAGARVSEEVQRLKTSTSQPEEAQAENSFMAALREAAARDAGSGQVTDSELGKVSQRFVQDKAAGAKAAQLGDRGAAQQLARIDAPYLQRVREGVSAGRTASDLSVLDNQARGQDFLQQLRQSLVQPNAGQMAFGQLLTGASQAFAGRAQPPALKKPGVFNTAPVQIGSPDWRVS